jgi:hypothetical protein
MKRDVHILGNVDMKCGCNMSQCVQMVLQEAKNMSEKKRFFSEQETRQKEFQCRKYKKKD